MPPISSSLTDQLIEQIWNSEPLRDPACQGVALQGVIDYFASGLQARRHHDSLKLLASLSEEGGKPCSWLIGHSSYVTSRQAALFNGFQAHLLDYDDVHAQVRGHPSAVILSALLASLANNDVSSHRFLAAYVIGIEVMARLGSAVGDYHYQTGWHNTATLGGIAATAALCYLHRYPFINDALAMAATQASGLRLMFGTSVKPLHAGLAAQAAILACQLAKAGLTAECDIFARTHGFLAVYSDTTAQLDLSNWGAPWRIVSPGLWFKCYAFCSAAAYIADATAYLIDQHTINPNDVRQINLTFAQQSDAALVYQQVTHHAQGRFSAEYIVAALLLKRPLTWASFNQQPLDRPLCQLMAKVTRYRDPQAQQRYAQVTILLDDGRALTATVTDPKGSPGNPYTRDALKAKFFAAIGDVPLAQQGYAILSGLETNRSLRPIIDQFSQLFT